MRSILLLRHAKSSHDEPGLPDHDRRLTGRGRKSAELIGRYMAKRHLLPDLVLCSSARRTRETWTLLAPNLGAPPKVRYMRELYMATADEILAQIRAVDDRVASLMVIGHNPGLGAFAQDIAQKGDSASLARLREKYPTGALALVMCDTAGWRDLVLGSGRLEAFVAPRELAS
jgi:phosphohistidine phosphatase